MIGAQRTLWDTFATREIFENENHQMLPVQSVCFHLHSSGSIISSLLSQWDEATLARNRGQHREERKRAARWPVNTCGTLQRKQTTWWVLKKGRLVRDHLSSKKREVPTGGRNQGGLLGGGGVCAESWERPTHGAFGREEGIRSGTGIHCSRCLKHSV